MSRYANAVYASDELSAAFADGIGMWTPARQGITAWTCDPLFFGGQGIAFTSGKTYLSPVIPWRDNDNVTTLYVDVNVVATTPTAGQNFLGLYDASGNRLGVSSDISTPLTSTGLLTATLTAPASVKATQLYYVAVLQNASTPARLVSGRTNTSVNIGNGRFINVTASGQTALPSPLGTTQPINNSFWVAIL